MQRSIEYRKSRPRPRRGVGRKRHLSGRHVEIPDRVMVRLFKDMRKLSTGCWLPAGSLKANGYKHVYWTDAEGVDRTLTSQHAIGRLFHRCGDVLGEEEIPHHTCVNAWCINPDHIEVIEREDHVQLHVKLRGAGYRRKSAA